MMTVVFILVHFVTDQTIVAKPLNSNLSDIKKIKF